MGAGNGKVGEKQADLKKDRAFFFPLPSPPFPPSNYGRAVRAHGQQQGVVRRSDLLFPPFPPQQCRFASGKSKSEGIRTKNTFPSSFSLSSCAIEPGVWRRERTRAKAGFRLSWPSFFSPSSSLPPFSFLPPMIGGSRCT